MITAGRLRLPADVARSLARASMFAGVDLRLLIGVANRESAFRSDAHAATSSASGLFQFIDSTWLRAIRDYGDRHGLAKEAALVDANGEVHDPATRKAILELRKNPDIAASMAAEMLRHDALSLKDQLNRKLTDADIYAAHFLGLQKAGALAKLNDSAPSAAAAKVFPGAAYANRSIFFRAKGKRRSSRSIHAVYGSMALPYAEDTDAIARQVQQMFGGALQPQVSFVSAAAKPAPAQSAAKPRQEASAPNEPAPAQPAAKPQQEASAPDEPAPAQPAAKPRPEKASAGSKPAPAQPAAKPRQEKASARSERVAGGRRKASTGHGKRATIRSSGRSDGRRLHGQASQRHLRARR